MAREYPLLNVSEVIKKIHGLFSGKFSDPEVAGWFTAIVGNTAADERIREQAQANPTMEQFANGDYMGALASAVIQALSSHHSLSDQMLQNPEVFADSPNSCSQRSTSGRARGHPHCRWR